LGLVRTALPSSLLHWGRWPNSWQRAALSWDAFGNIDFQFRDIDFRFSDYFLLSL